MLEYFSSLCSDQVLLFLINQNCSQSFSFMPDCLFVFSDIIWPPGCFIRNMLLKGQFETLFVWTIENLAVPLVAFSAQTQQLWGRRKLFWHYKGGILLLLWRFTGKIRQCAVLPLLQFPSTLFISPPPFPFWLLFHILFQPKQGFYFTPSPSPLFCCCFDLQLQLWALTPNWQPKLTQLQLLRCP